MKSSTKDMTIGTPWKLIVSFAIPIFISNVFQQLYNSADSLIVGNFVGKEALAAVSSSGSLIFLFTSFFIGLSAGAGVVISKYFGSKDYTNMKDVIHTDVAMGLVASLILTILGVLLTPFILKLMGTAEEVLPNSIVYFRIYFFGVTGVIMYNIFSGILQALGNSRVPLFFLVLSSITNILLDLLFIAVMHQGVGAAALATAISQALSASLCFIYLIRPNTLYRIDIKKIRFHKDKLIEIIHYGLPAGIQNSVIGLANVVVQGNINAFGEDAMAGCGSYMKIEGFAFLPVTCFTMALTTFVGQNLGAKEYERAKKGSRFGIITSVLLAEVIGATMWLLAPNLIKLFNDDPNVVAFGVKQLKTESLFYSLLAFSHCIAAVCRGAGKAVVPMSIMLAIWCVLRVTYLSIVMRFVDDIVFVFWAYPLTWGISSVIYLFYYLFCDWIHGFDKKNQVLEVEK